ncbi:MAG: HEPN domain-containing protein [Candidatus Zixiibacteriota bacterium]
MLDPDQVRLLLEIARRDLRAARGMSDPAVFPDEIFGFQAQQAVEKCLKGWLAFLDVEYPKIHDLDELFLMLSEAGAPIATEWRALSELTPFAVQFRYDTLDIGQSGLNRAEIVARIEHLIDHLAQLISK